jgi:2-dehydro-3-deoxyphosphogluconate aldolase/(4S)-4-hydroxy-2-oxoglutarate aldolase
MNSPYGYLDLQYVPLGGVNQANLRTWLQQSFVIAVGGSWVADKKLIAAQNFDEITRRAERAHSIFKEVRG